MDMLNSLGIDPKLVFVQVFGFLVLLWLLNKFVFSKIFVILDERQADIKATYDQLDADRASMAATRKEYEDRLAGIETEARTKIQAAVKEAQELRASIIADAQKQAKTVIDNGRAELDRERTRTFIELRQQIADLAILAATRVVGESMDDARQRKLVDQYIAGVSTVSNTDQRASSNGAGAS
jgi:F-type H+-transporting ATPase subunit b